MPEQQPNEVVYVLGAPGSNTVKIGRTNDLAKRLAEIQRMSPVPLQALWNHPGGYELETNLHRQFSALRTHGEWFSFGGDPVHSVQWAIADQPWLRDKISLKKKTKPAPRGSALPGRGPADSPEQLALKMARAREGLKMLLSNLAQIQNPADRYEVAQMIESELPVQFRDVYRNIATDLKQSRRTWRQVGEAMGSVSGQRAHQISLGGAPLYGAKVPQGQQAS